MSPFTPRRAIFAIAIVALLVAGFIVTGSAPSARTEDPVRAATIGVATDLPVIPGTSASGALPELAPRRPAKARPRTSAGHRGVEKRGATRDRAESDVRDERRGPSPGKADRGAPSTPRRSAGAVRPRSRPSNPGRPTARAPRTPAAPAAPAAPQAPSAPAEPAPVEEHPAEDGGEPAAEEEAVP